MRKVLPKGIGHVIVPPGKEVYVMSLSGYLREQRNKKDWSQRDLASAADVSNAEISRIESGKRKSPNPAVLRAIAKALGVPVDQIYEEAGIIEKGQKFVVKYLEEHGDTPISELSAASSQRMMPTDLSDDELTEVLKYIDFLRSKRPQ